MQKLSTRTLLVKKRMEKIDMCISNSSFDRRWPEGESGKEDSKLGPCRRLSAPSRAAEPCLCRRRASTAPGPTALSRSKNHDRTCTHFSIAIDELAHTWLTWSPVIVWGIIAALTHHRLRIWNLAEAQRRNQAREVPHMHLHVEQACQTLLAWYLS